MQIREKILQKLAEAEEQEHVTVLHAVESGSRAWGFASPDSDYDVRFIYVRREADYLKLGMQRDVIEWQLDDVYDISGWDLQKALRLLHGSNPSLLEWCNSPVVYRTTDYWAGVKDAADAYFSEKAGANHYLSMAKHNYNAYLTGETVRLKKYFYVLRPVLACRWILERHSIPPVAFAELLDSMLDPAMRPIVHDLMQQKMQTPELGEGAKIPLLHAYLTEQISALEQAVPLLPKEQYPDWTPLDRLFLDGIRQEHRAIIYAE